MEGHVAAAPLTGTNCTLLSDSGQTRLRGGVSLSPTEQTSPPRQATIWLVVSSATRPQCRPSVAGVMIQREEPWDTAETLPEVSPELGPRSTPGALADT